MSTSVLFDDLGPRGRRQVHIASVAAVVVIAYGLWVAIGRLSDKGQFAANLWDPLTTWPVQKGLLIALGRTIKAAALSMSLAILVGALMALGRLAKNRPLRWICGVYVELFRAIPIYVMISFAFLGLHQYDIELSAFWSLVLGLSLYNSAMLAEIFRAGILSLDRGQSEASLALGMTYWQSMMIVIIPQAARRMVPGILSQLVALLKDTSLGGALTYLEVLKTAGIYATYYGNQLQMLVVAALMYMSVNLVLSAFARRLEVRQRRRYKASAIQVAGGSEDVAATV